MEEVAEVCARPHERSQVVRVVVGVVVAFVVVGIAVGLCLFGRAAYWRTRFSVGVSVGAPTSADKRRAGDGKISMHELRNVLKAANVSSAGALEAMRAVDSNGDGTVDFDEFMAMMRTSGAPPEGLLAR